MQKIKRKKTTQFLGSMRRAFRSDIWVFIAPFLTVLLGAAAWIALAVSKTARLDTSRWILNSPQPLTSVQILLGAAILFLVAAALYFWFDYKQHITLLRRDDPKIKYSAVHHAEKVVLPKLKYNWKQSLYWMGYGLASMVVIASVLAFHVKPTYAYAPNEFVFTAHTTYEQYASPSGNYITIATNSDDSNSYPGEHEYHYNVDWGDGTVTTGHTENASHVYASAGAYEIKITGLFPQLAFGYGVLGDEPITIKQWGNNPWQELGNAFIFADSVVIEATDIPNLSQVTDLSGMFRETSMNSDISDWDMSSVTNISGMFAYNQEFNQDISPWNVSNVTDMSNLFLEATAFNQNISSWDTGKVTDMNWMFMYASSFNQPLNDWDVSNVANMSHMFGASAFNQPLNDWDVGHVTDMSSMFALATSFNRPLGNWDVSSVTNMQGVFAYATSFNQPLNGWDVSNVTDMYGMFFGGSGISTYNYDTTLIGWAVLPLQSGVTFSGGTSRYCSSATQRSDIISSHGWVITDSGSYCSGSSTPPFVVTNAPSGITGSEAAIHGEVIATGGSAITAAGFEYSLDTSYGSNTGSLSTSIGSFSHTLSSLECGKKYNVRAYATNTQGTAYGANKTFITADCPRPFITTWKTDNPGSSASDQITLPIIGTDYVVEWGDGNVTTGETGNPTHTYANAGTYTIKITGTFSSIYFNNMGDREKILTVEQWGSNQWGSMYHAFDGAVNLTVPATDAPDLSNVTTVSYMFAGATQFNTDIDDWDVSNVEYMSGMFQDATAFNQPLNSWDVSNVEDMYRMFRGAASFNQPLDSWDTSSLTNLTSIFSGATSFNQNINAWDVSNVTSMDSIFYGAHAFNQPLSSWDVSNVTYMAGLFMDATSFNQPLDDWDIGNVEFLHAVFAGATAFNQPLNSWNTSSVTTMHVLFAGATSFDQSLASWDVSHLDYPSGMNMFLSAPISGPGFTLYPNGLSTANYDATLASWATQNLQSGLTFDAGTSTYCAAAAARQSIIDNFNWTIIDGGENCVPTIDFSNAFITTWKTNNPGGSDGNQIKIPTTGGGYNYSVDWGDGNVDTGLTDTITHSYPEAGTYTVKITGDFPRICFAYSAVGCLNGDDRGKILTIEQWGDIHWSSMSHAFWGVDNLEIPATDSPDLSGVTDMSAMFANAQQFNANIGHWDVSNVTDMSTMFGGAYSFNSNINNWDVSNVTDMSNMFIGAVSFNQPLDNWNTSSVVDMSMMFSQAASFNQPIGNWNVSSVLSMLNMFNDAALFNQNINDWDTSSVQVMHGMFRDAMSFNQPLNNWDTSSVQFMATMFSGATSFNQNINSWNVGSVTEMDSMFNEASSFNQPLDSWNIISVNSFSAMFAGATSFNQPLNNWDTSSVTHPYGMAYMFMQATSFNQPLNNWDVSSVENMAFMFAGATSFNQPLNHWNTSSLVHAEYLFAGASSFNQSLADWDVSHVTSMEMMFLSATYGPLSSSGLSTENYDATLAAWSVLGLKSDVTFDAGVSTYCNSADKRQSIIATFNWTINDHGEACINGEKHVVTSQPGKPTSSQVLFKGTVTGSEADRFVSAGFEWGADANYGSNIDGLTIYPDGFDYQASVVCGKQYHYRAYAQDQDNNKTYGNDVVFTLVCPDPEISASNKAPVVSITSPKNGSIFTTNQEITLSADAQDPDGSIKEVRFYLNGALFGTAYKAPYQIKVHSSQMTRFQFTAIAIDNDGASTASEQVRFSVLDAAASLLVGKPSDRDQNNKQQLSLDSPDISQQTKDSLIFGGTSYKPKSILTQIARGLPWFVLQLFAVLYLGLAYRQARQNNLLKQTLKLTNQTRENIESFLSIITHYLGTSVAVIGLAADVVPAASPAAASAAQFKPVASQLKEYANGLIARLTVQTSEVKQKLKTGGLITRNSIYRWVLLPTGVAAVLMAASYLGMFNVWSGERGFAIFSGLLLVAGAVAMWVFFEVWQNQRQLKVDLAATTNTAEKSLHLRRNFILETQAFLATEVAYVKKEAAKVDDPVFRRHFEGGITQLNQVSGAFTKIFQLTAAVGAGTTRAYIPVNQILSALEPQAAQKHIALRLNAVASIKTNLLPTELEHILSTLVANSIQFSPMGSEVFVQVRNERRRLVIKVVDKGEGISKDKQRTLMQPFSRGTSTETYNYEGLGMNLYITRLIAQKYGGHVEILSHEGKGTAVTVRI